MNIPWLTTTPAVAPDEEDAVLDVLASVFSSLLFDDTSVVLLPVTSETDMVGPAGSCAR
jgi:hypothetical protein